MLHYLLPLLELDFTTNTFSYLFLRVTIQPYTKKTSPLDYPITNDSFVRPCMNILFHELKFSYQIFPFLKPSIVYLID